MKYESIGRIFLPQPLPFSILHKHFLSRPDEQKLQAPSLFLYQLIPAVRGRDGFRTTEVQIGELTLKVGVVTGLKNVVPILEDLKSGKLDLHFIEVMTCPAGCVSGGGQPKLLLEEYRETAYDNRIKATYKHDANLPLRKSHNNPEITKIYSKFLKEPLGKVSHSLLHTKYCIKNK